MKLETKIYIDKVAEAVVGEYGLKRPFCDLELKVQEMGGKIIERKGLDPLIDTIIRKVDQSHFELLIPKQLKYLSRVEQILLELGHLFLHMGFRTNYECWMSQNTNLLRFPRVDQYEQARVFCLAVMMPEQEFHLVLVSAVDGKRVQIDRIAQHFNVTNNLAIQRGRKLDLFE